MFYFYLIYEEYSPLVVILTTERAGSYARAEVIGTIASAGVIVKVYGITFYYLHKLFANSCA